MYHSSPGKIWQEKTFRRRNNLQFITLKGLCNFKAILLTWLVLIEMQSVWRKKNWLSCLAKSLMLEGQGDLQILFAILLCCCLLHILQQHLVSMHSELLIHLGCKISTS